jgi:cytochrome P450
MAWVVSRVADVEAVLRSDAFLSPDASSEIRAVAARVGLEPAALTWALDALMPAQTGASHRAARETVTRLMPQVMVRWTRERLNATARQFVSELQEGDAVDVVPGLVDALPNTVAADMFGLSIEDVVWLRDCSLQTMSAWRRGVPLRDYAKLERAAGDARAFLEAPSRGSALPGVEFFLLAAAVVTTSGTLGAALCVLAQHPDLQQTLRGRPERITGLVEEVLRLGGAVRRLSRRIAGVDFELDSVVIPADASVILDIERAGRDPAVYHDPETLDLERKVRPVLAFGGGEHPCMGPRLARLEMAAALEALLSQFELRPAGEPAFAGNRDVRCFKTLRIGLRRRPTLLAGSASGGRGPSRGRRP